MIHVIILIVSVSFPSIFTHRESVTHEIARAGYENSNFVVWDTVGTGHESLSYFYLPEKIDLLDDRYREFYWRSFINAFSM